MYATYSTESKILNFLREERTSTIFLSTLAELRGLRGASQSRLSQMQRGKALELEAAAKLQRLMVELETLRELCKPIPVRFDDARAINNLLDLLEKKILQVVVFENDYETGSTAPETPHQQ
jgi:hypothetical protein